MRTNMLFVCCTLVCIVGTVAVTDVRSHSVKEVIPKEAESRLRAI
jgi:hypothetical protein